MAQKEQTFEIRDLRNKDKFVIDDKFFDKYVSTLGVYVLGVYCALCRHADKGQKCWPSINKIAKELNVSKRKVIQCLKTLESLNVIRVVRAKGGRKPATNSYVLLDKRHWKPLPKEASEKEGWCTTDTNDGAPHAPGWCTTCTRLVSEGNHKETHRRKYIEGYIYNQPSKILKLSSEKISDPLEEKITATKRMEEIFNSLKIKGLFEGISTYEEWCQSLKGLKNK